MTNEKIIPETAYMTAEDLPELAALENECFSVPWSEDALGSELKNDRALFLTAKLDGKVLGYIGSHLVAGECYITNIAVFPEFRRSGVAGALIKKLCLILREKNADFVTLEVRSSNSGAIAFYESIGFSRMGTIKNMYEKPREDALIYTLRLNGE